MTLEQLKGGGAAPFQALCSTVSELRAQAFKNTHFANEKFWEFDKLRGVLENLDAKLSRSAERIASLESVVHGDIANVSALLVKHSPEFADELARAAARDDQQEPSRS